MMNRSDIMAIIYLRLTDEERRRIEKAWLGEGGKCL